MAKLKNQLKQINMDHIRLIMAFMIIAIHTYPLASFSNTADYIITRILFRIAVPVYLTITGYYILPKALKNKDTLIKYIKKISIVYLLASIIYIPLIIKPLLNKGIYAIIVLIKNLLFTGVMNHLWYFPALILGIIITYLIIKYIPKEYQLALAICLYILGLLGDNYYGLICNIKLLKSIYSVIINITGYTRNFLFFVPLFLIIGYKISLKEDKISKKNNLIGIIIFTILMTLEGLFIYYKGSPLHTSMYVCLPVLTYFIFNYMICYLNKEENKPIRKISTIIYIIHPWLIAVISKVKFIDNNLIIYLIVSITSYYISKLLILYLKSRKNMRLEFLNKLL